MTKKVIIIAGATGSGKSALARAKALEIAGVVINADSMQVYQDLAILTACPALEDMKDVPHKLYGFMTGAENCSAAKWVKLAAAEIESAWVAGKVPIVTGGTGLYISALVKGLADVPDVPPEVRDEVRAMDFALAREKLKAVDMPIYERFADKHRTLRALEVFMATGKPLSWWQKLPLTKEIEADFETIYLEPERAELYRRLDERFVTMIEAGAIEEVQALLAKNYSPSATVLKALGVAEIASYLRGEFSYDEMILKAQQSTRNYAKRQVTWFRHQL